MKLYLISQPEERVDYDTYDSAVVCCDTEEEARFTRPGQPERCFETWCPPHLVTVRFLGFAHASVKRGVVCASFNAG